MKKPLLLLFSLLMSISFNNYAQTTWTRVSADTTKITNLNSGNVGVGTSAPSAKLDVLGGTNGSLFQITTSQQVPDIRLRQTGTYDPATRNWAVYTNNSKYGSLEIGVGSASYLDDYATKFSIDLSGKVGIGTTSPVDALSVAGEMGIQAGNKFRSFSGSNNDLNYIDLYDVNGGVNFFTKYGINTPSQGYYKFYTASSDSATLSIISNGRVGIGTSAPDAMLAVKGIIHSQEVKIDLTGWPDYVFKPTYNLLPLAAVKNYIVQNQHLPGMPSEQELIDNGLKLGQMENILTKKVEELTLYLIEKDKELDEQKKQIALQEERLKKLEALLQQNPAAGN